MGKDEISRKENIVPVNLQELVTSIQNNCLISDAGFAGTYSLCTLMLRLRNLYKWENDMEPWSEPSPPDLLEWIEAREKSWESIWEEPLQSLKFNGHVADPLDGSAVNLWIKGTSLLYGAGYGRSMKPVFFLAEKREEKTVEGLPLFVLGKELARELASPFAMSQEEVIYIRREPLRFYFWDQIQEVGAGGKKGIHQALQNYEVIGSNGSPDRELLINALDGIVDIELETFVYHEVGELKEENLKSEITRRVIDTFPYSPIEYLTRTVKDLLADTHPSGLFNHIISKKKESSLSFYVGFLDGLRQLLFPEINKAYYYFLEDGNWQHIIRAAADCRENMLQQAAKIIHIVDLLDGKKSKREVESYVEKEILSPLGIGRQES